MVGLPQNPHRESGRLVGRLPDLPAELYNSAVLLNQTLRGKEGPEVPIGVKHPLTDAKGYAVVALYGFLAAGVDPADGLVDTAVDLGRSIVVVQRCLGWSADNRRGGYNGFDVGLSQYRWSK